MLQLSYVGIAFAAVFYLVFGIAVRLMELSDNARNKARLGILMTSLSVFFISSLFSGLLNLGIGSVLYGVLFLVFSAASLVTLISILIELHQIKTRVKMRRFMVLFDIVDRFLTEGKTREEIIDYLIGIQKLTQKEAADFLEFITDPANHQFLVDVNEKIQEARMMKTLKN